MNTHQKLLHILTKEDQRLEKREMKRGTVNVYRLGHFMNALDQAESHKGGIVAGLNASFCESRLLDRLLKVASE